MIAKEFYCLKMISIYMAITVYASIHPTRWWFRLRLELRLVASELVSQWLVRQFAPLPVLWWQSHFVEPLIWRY